MRKEGAPLRISRINYFTSSSVGSRNYKRQPIARHTTGLRNFGSRILLRDQYGVNNITDKIHGFSKMFLHHREDLVNFDQVLGIGNFHEKKRSNISLKLLKFRDFCKYHHLKIRCLIA